MLYWYFLQIKAFPHFLLITMMIHDCDYEFSKERKHIYIRFLGRSNKNITHFNVYNVLYTLHKIRTI